MTTIKKDPRILGASLLLGGVYFLCMAAELCGLKYTTSSTCSFLENTAIVMVPMIEAILLRRKPVAQKPISSETAGIICALNPLTSAVLGWIVLGENLGFDGIIGAILIIAGIILPNLKTFKPWNNQTNAYF